LAFFTPVERSTVHLPTLGQPKAKPKPNQTKPGWAAAAPAAAAADIEPTTQILVTYCFALTNKTKQTNKQTNQKPTNQPTNPSSTPRSKQPKKPTTNKTKQRVCSRFKPQKQKTPPSPLTNPYQKKQNKTKQNNKITQPHTHSRNSTPLLPPFFLPPLILSPSPSHPPT
jgi:hypothetical protein